ncbi:MAG TPA: DUF4231 domain-containing protein [Solirubrobacteraceae bacterium]|jgi:hypothetical protein|nr:DUF4231 domain-containing protein [Solirubrobacteraceae bacterium]
MNVSDSKAGRNDPVKAFDERRALVKLIRERVAQLGGDDSARDLREVFISRYEAELENWKRRRGLFHTMFLAVTVGTGALGVVSAGLAAVARGSRSTLITIALIVVGVVVAALAAVVQVFSPQRRYLEYKRDEALLRRLGWRFLRELEEGEAPTAAYATFRADTSETLDTEHLSSGEN